MFSWDMWERSSPSCLPQFYLYLVYSPVSKSAEPWLWLIIKAGINNVTLRIIRAIFLSQSQIYGLELRLVVLDGTMCSNDQGSMACPCEQTPPKFGQRKKFLIKVSDLVRAPLRCSSKIHQQKAGRGWRKIRGTATNMVAVILNGKRNNPVDKVSHFGECPCLFFSMM